MSHQASGAIRTPAPSLDQRFRDTMTASAALHGGAAGGCNRCQEYMQKCHYEHRINGAKGFHEAVDEWRDHLYPDRL